MILFVVLACLVCDQGTKIIARQRLPKHTVLSYGQDIFRWQYAENPGAFLSLGANISQKARYWIFVLWVGGCLSGLLIYLILAKGLPRLQTLALSLVLGGGWGNLVDRIGNEGRVIDFMNVGIGPLRTGVFNVADMVISCGVVIFLLLSIRGECKQQSRPTKS